MHVQRHSSATCKFYSPASITSTLTSSTQGSWFVVWFFPQWKHKHKVLKTAEEKVKGRTPGYFQSIVDTMDFIHDGRTWRGPVWLHPPSISHTEEQPNKQTTIPEKKATSRPTILWRWKTSDWNTKRDFRRDKQESISCNFNCSSSEARYSSASVYAIMMKMKQIQGQLCQ